MSGQEDATPPAAAGQVRTNDWGGSAGASGMNLQARMAAVVGVHLLAPKPLGWLGGLEIDAPVELQCETGGPGDDLHVVLANGLVVEAQVKKGLSRGAKLWEALEALARGIHRGQIAYGVLVIDNDASQTISRELSQGIVRLAAGRVDGLNDITSEFRQRLEAAQLDVAATCRRLRIKVVHCAEHDDATAQVAEGELQRLYGNLRDAKAAWSEIQRAAHQLAEYRTGWTPDDVRHLLKAAHVELVAASSDQPPAAVAGWVWPYLDEMSHHGGFIEAFRQHYLVSERANAHPFGGREEEYRRLDAWLFDSSTPSRYLISAPTARGKSALLVQWTQRLVSDATWAVVFVPISVRFGTDAPATFYGLLASQLARALQVTLPAPQADQAAYYQGMCSTLIQQAAKESRHILIVLDGVDEALADSFNPTVIPPSLPPSIKVLVSAREHAGDVGPEGWLRRLAWQGGTRALSQTLSTLDRSAVGPVLRSAGIEQASIDEGLVDRLMTLSQGEPLLLGLYAEDLAAIAKAGQLLGAEVLDDLSPGFSAYFARAFDARRLGSDGDDQETVDTTLAILAMALGPIEGSHLTDLVCRLRGVPRPMASGRFIRPLRRFIAGDGSAERGYVLNHPKLGEYLREEHFDAVTRQVVGGALLDWGRAVAASLAADPNAPAPTYVIHRHVEHLRRAGTVALPDIELLLSDGWRQAWLRVDKDFVGYADSLLGACMAMHPCTAYGSQAAYALRLRVKIALMAGSVKAQGINIPGELLEMALRDQLASLQQALNIVQLVAPENRTNYQLDLAPSLPASKLEALALDLLRVDDINIRCQSLARLVPHLNSPQRDEVIGRILAWMSESLTPQMAALTSILASLDGAQLDQATAQTLARAMAQPGTPGLALAAAPLINALHDCGHSDLAEPMIDQCLRWIDGPGDALLALEALGPLAARVDARRVDEQIKRLVERLDLPRAILELQVSHSSPYEAEALMRRQRLASAAITLDILRLRDLPTQAYMTGLRGAVAPLLHPDYWIFEPLVDAMALVRSDARQELVALAHQVALNLPSANNRTHALLKLAKVAHPPLRQAIVANALTSARCIDDGYGRGMPLVSLFSTLGEQDKRGAYQAVLADVQKVDYVLHKGELLLQLSDQLPPTSAALADLGMLQIQRAADSLNSVSTMLREAHRLPEGKQRAVFEWCWQRVLGKSHRLYRVQFGMLASWATRFWTAEHLAIARHELATGPLAMGGGRLSGLMPVAARLGAQDLIDRAIEEIVAMPDIGGRVLSLAHALRHLPPDDARCELMSRHWFPAMEAGDAPTIALVEGFSLLSGTDKKLAWSTLVAQAKRETINVGQSLARLSVVASDPSEKADLMQAALAACAVAEPVDQRPAQAAEIAVLCETDEARWRALEIMTSPLAAPRGSMLHALSIAAPALAASGGGALVLGVIQDIRQAAAWWP